MSDDDRQKPKIEFRSTRDKTNDVPTHIPANDRTNNPSLSPIGTMGVRSQDRAAHNEPRDVSTTKEHPPENPKLHIREPLVTENAYYTDGKLLSMPEYRFMARVVDEPSHDGMDGGRIEQLSLEKDGKTVALYNRGWVKDPQTAEQREAIHRIRNGLDDTRQKEFEGFTQDPNKSKGLER